MTSCGPSEEEKEACKAARKQIEIDIRKNIKNTFDAPFPKRNRNLSRILGDSFQVYGECDDILSFKVISTRNLNSIINTETGETIFKGTVCKYRDLYYFNEKINNTVYRIFALKINDSLIYGLQNYFQYYQVDTLIENGEYPKLVKSIDKPNKVIRLHPDKKELRRLYTSIIENTTPFRIVKIENVSSTTNAEEKVDPIESDDFDLLSKVYPNPTTNFITIQLQQKGLASFQLTDLNGKSIIQGQLKEIENKIDMSNLNPGIYALTIFSTTDDQKETTKIVKI